MDDYEKKKRQEEQAKAMKERWAANSKGFQAGFLDKKEDDEAKEDTWKKLKSMFGAR